VRGRNLPSPITLVIGLYNSLYYCTSHNDNITTTTTINSILKAVFQVKLGQPFPPKFSHPLVPDKSLLYRPALVAEWAMPLAAVQAGQGSFPVRVEA